MVFHCLSVPYAPTRKEISLCAFVQKVYKFCNEMTKRGHTVYHYGHEDSIVDCTEHVNVINNDILKESYGNLNNWKDKGFDQNVNTKAVKIFNTNCINELNKRIKSDKEFILCWFGFAHEPCVKYFYDKAIVIEPSIGYDSMFAPIKIFETYSQMHKMHGHSTTHIGLGSEYVVYPGFESKDFIYKKDKSNTALFLGRITEEKGAKLVYDICNNIGQDIIFAGPNLLNLKDTKHCKFIGFVEPSKRMHLLSDAKFLFAPSLFIEPCNWTVIEAQFSGTATITTNFGGFIETVLQGHTGLRCSTVNDIIYSVQNINKLINPENCYKNAVTNYTIEKQCNYYEYLFKMLLK
ncbi:glycosyltransferase [archaeon]|nr:glycosyltransferase [archaeon]NDB54363.1 glycosyltransferase [archaeon]